MAQNEMAVGHGGCRNGDVWYAASAIPGLLDPAIVKNRVHLNDMWCRMHRQ
jgi:hypothetical protein